jgi:hypothetical protein
MLTLTPYIGWDLVFVNTTSNVVDFRPDRPLAEAQSNPTEDTGVFEQVSLRENQSNRFYGGIRFISRVLEITGEFSSTRVYGGYSVLAFSARLGLDF